MMRFIRKLNLALLLGHPVLVETKKGNISATIGQRNIVKKGVY